MLRNLMDSDLTQVIEIEYAAQVVPWSADVFKRCLSFNYDAWVIDLDQKVVGFIIVSVIAYELHILNLCIHPHYQRRGFGLKLLNYALHQAKLHGDSMAYLEVRCSNKSAIALYDKVGFVQIGERKNYYPTLSAHEDALVFAKELGNFEN